MGCLVSSLSVERPCHIIISVGLGSERPRLGSLLCPGSSLSVLGPVTHSLPSLPGEGCFLCEEQAALEWVCPERVARATTIGGGARALHKERKKLFGAPAGYYNNSQLPFFCFLAERSLFCFFVSLSDPTSCLNVNRCKLTPPRELRNQEKLFVYG